MKTSTILSGLIVTGTVVSAGSIGLGAASKNKHLQKQNINNKRFTSTYHNAFDSLILKSQYEKAYLQSMNSFKKAIVNNDDKIKILKNSTM